MNNKEQFETIISDMTRDCRHVLTNIQHSKEIRKTLYEKLGLIRSQSLRYCGETKPEEFKLSASIAEFDITICLKEDERINFEHYLKRFKAAIEG